MKTELFHSGSILPSCVLRVSGSLPAVSGRTVACLDSTGNLSLWGAIEMELRPSLPSEKNGFHFEIPTSQNRVLRVCEWPELKKIILHDMGEIYGQYKATSSGLPHSPHFC